MFEGLIYAPAGPISGYWIAGQLVIDIDALQSVRLGRGRCPGSTYQEEANKPEAG
jgi:hypothetical protein